MNIRSLAQVFTLAALLLGSAATYGASSNGNHSPFDDGRWVKIGVDTTGVYEFSYDELRAMGFGKPETVRVFGYGGVLPNEHRFDGSVPDGIPATPSVHTSDNRLVFYAEGSVRAKFKNGTTTKVDVTRNPYDRRGHYFLSDTKTGSEMPRQAYSGGQPTGWHYCIDLSEREVQQAGDGGGAIFHGPRMNAGEAETAKFRIRNFGRDDDKTPEGIVECEAALETTKKITLGLQIDNAGSATADIRSSGVTTVPQQLWAKAEAGGRFYSSSSQPLTDCEIDATVTIPSNFSGNYAAIDRIYTIYPRLNILEDDTPELMLNYPGAEVDRAISISGAVPDIEIWDVTDPAAVRRLETSYDASSLSARATLDAGSDMRRLVVFDPAKRHRRPVYEGDANKSSLHAAATPELLIISTHSLLESAEELAAIHRDYGQSVRVVDQEALFDSFGSGSRTPAAIRRAVKMLYDRSPGTLRSVLLYGPSGDDPRFIRRAQADILPSFICEQVNECCNSAQNYISDQYFGMLSDSFDPLNVERERMLLATGRLPIEKIQNAQEINEKIRRYLTQGPTAAMGLRVYKSSDKLNDAIHMKYATEATAQMQAANELLTVTHADFALYNSADDVKVEQPVALLERALIRGTGLFFYSGHGGATSLSSTDFYNLGRIDKYEYDVPPLMVLASCTTYAYDRPERNIGSSTVLAPRGGSIGTIGACREVFLEYNRPLSNAIGRAFGEARGGAMTGDILKNARDILADGGSLKGDMAKNVMCFNFCGDPALPLSLPHYDIAIDDLWDEKLPSGKEIEVRARIVDATGATVTDFDGSVLIEVFDQAIVRESKVPAVKEKIACDDNLLAEYGAAVHGGIIATTIYLPTPAEESSSSRIVITADDGHSRRRAAGMLKKGGIGQSSDSSGSQPPVITGFGVNSADFIADGYVNPDFTLTATIDPSESGLSTGVSGIRNRVALFADGKKVGGNISDALLYNSDGSVTFRHRIKNAAFGRHIYELHVPNNAGATASATVEITVGSPAETGTLTTTSGATVRKDIELDFDASARPVRLIIVDYTGNTVLSVPSPLFPYRWDLKRSDGTRVPDGHYKAWVMLESLDAYGATPALEITVTGGLDATPQSISPAESASGEKLDLSRCRVIEPGTYAGRDINELVLPSNGKLTIGAGAFAATKIRHLVINCDAEIGEGAFAACQNLEQITIAGTGSVGAYAFRNCTRLKTADISGATSLGDYAFAGCASLGSIKVDGSLTAVGTSAFEGCILEKIDLSNTSSRTIGPHAFGGNNRLKHASLPESVEEIGRGAFFGCVSLTGLSLPVNCRILDAYSLKGLRAVETLSLPVSLLLIGEGTMEGMTGLTEIDATALAAVPSLGSDVWYGLDCSTIKLKVTANTEEAFSEADQWREFDICRQENGIGDIIAGAETKIKGRIEGNTIYIESDGADIHTIRIYNTAGTELYNATAGSQLASAELPDTSGRLYLAHVLLADGTSGVLKIARYGKE